MTSSKTTKRALLSSVLAVLMCVAMLVGTTFAWFTDTASTAVNKIVAGNLKVDIIGETDNTHVDTLNFVKADATTDEETILWEPGCRYLTEGFRIVNNGNLALKWKAQINTKNIIDGKASADAKDGMSLLDVIDFYIVTGKEENAAAVKIEDFTGKLKKTETSGVYYIKGVMQTTAGNDYQDLTLEGITITVYATQDTVEEDSFDNTYDEKATYPVVDADDMKAALADGGIVEVGADLDTGNEAMKVTKDATINMNGKTIENTENIWADANGTNGNWSVISVRDGANLTIDGNGTFKAKENDSFTVDVKNGSTVTIKNGTFISNVSVVYVLEGTAVIEGGFFDIQQKSSGTTVEQQYRCMLNCYNENHKNGTANIIVKGGTFVNYDPTRGDDNVGISFVADGYKVVSEEQANGDIWYTVVAK